MTELWLPIGEAEGRYSISNHGRVLNDVTGVIRVPSRGKLPNGYLTVDWRTDGRRVIRRIHILVLEHFVCPRPPGLCGLHKDDDKTNCHADNLYWGTHEQNMRDRLVNGHNPMAIKTHCSKCGEPYEGANLRVNGAGARVCRNCCKLRMRRRRAKMRLEMST